MRSIVIFSKTRNAWLLPLMIALSMLTIYLADVGYTYSLFYTNVATLPLLSISAITGAYFVPLFSSPNREMDRMLNEKTISVLRLAWIIGVVSSVIAVSTITLQLIVHPLFVPLLIRNQLFGIFVSLITSVVWKPRFAFLPITIYGLVCWLAGTQDLEATSRPWAQIMNSEITPTNAVLIALLAITATSLYVVFDGKELRK